MGQAEGFAYNDSVVDADQEYKHNGVCLFLVTHFLFCSNLLDPFIYLSINTNINEYNTILTYSTDFS